jgi:Ca2+-binding RTX toxin-like protein
LTVTRGSSRLLLIVLLFGIAAVASQDGASRVLTTMCEGREATIVGTEGNDVLSGTSGDDVISGLGGNDLIRGFAGNDVICGDAGNDTLWGNLNVPNAPESNILSGGDGSDKLRAGGDDTLKGGPSNDSLSASATYGSQVKLIFDGGDSTDVAVFERPVVANLADGTAMDATRSYTLVNIENLNGSFGKDTLIGNDSKNHINGGLGDDTIQGAGGNDKLIGYMGDDSLDGGTGNDTLIAGAGADTLDGGPDFDICKADQYDQVRNCEA